MPCMAADALKSLMQPNEGFFENRDVARVTIDFDCVGMPGRLALGPQWASLASAGGRMPSLGFPPKHGGNTLHTHGAAPEAEL